MCLASSAMYSTVSIHAVVILLSVMYVILSCGWGTLLQLSVLNVVYENVCLDSRWWF